MKLLTRYLIRQNLFLVGVILFIGVGIYVLTDLFEMLDRILESDMAMSTVAWLYLIKVPGIIAQLLPAIFLIASVLQFNLLARNKELVALFAGGISPMILLRFILVYALFWACVQFAFSEGIGVAGEREARSIWREQVHQKSLDNEYAKNLWLTDKNRVIHIETAYPRKKIGQNVRVYVLDKSGLQLEEMITAESFTIEPKRWVLNKGEHITAHPVQHRVFEEFDFSIKQDLTAYLFVEAWSKPEQLPIWELSSLIKRLKTAGSNTEGLQTTWHAKLSYALSLVVMGVLSLVILQWTHNVYRAIGISLVIIFLFYCLNTICVALGKGGSMPPMLAAWVTDGLSFLLFTAILLWPVLREKLSVKTARVK